MALKKKKKIGVGRNVKIKEGRSTIDLGYIVYERVEFPYYMQ